SLPKPAPSETSVAASRVGIQNPIDRSTIVVCFLRARTSEEHKIPYAKFEPATRSSLPTVRCAKARDVTRETSLVYVIGGNAVDPPGNRVTSVKQGGRTFHQLDPVKR